MKTLMIRGDQASFIRADGKSITTSLKPKRGVDMDGDPIDLLVAPKRHVMVHDPSGKYLRRCDVFFTTHTVDKNAPVEIDDNLAEAFTDYYGRGARIRNGIVDIPSGPWHRLCRVAGIRYYRYSTVPDYRGWFEHPFAPEVWLSENHTHDAWRVPLPEGCILDERGFVWP